jgi:quinol---cytochrome c reductase iron-sulfur subunit
MRKWLVSFLLLLVGRRRPKPVAEERIVPAEEPRPRAELLALALLGLAALDAVAFIVVYALDRLPSQTQFMGLALGLSLLFVAAALVVTSKRLVVEEELEEDYPAAEHVDEQENVVQVVEESGDKVTRRRLFKLAFIGTGGALGTALLVPLASLGPVVDIEPFYETPWKRGKRLVDEHGRPWRASDIEENDFYTAFPEGADKELLASPVVLVRLKQDQLDLPGNLAGYQAQGIVAYSKICTHAGCAISLYRAPLYQPGEPTPALVCPCHYSTFDPARGGKVTFGPAGRNLPMLPLSVDGSGFLRAAGTFDGPIGPSWWGVRMRRAK